MAEPAGTVLTSGETDTDRVTGAGVGVGMADRDVVDIEVHVSSTEEGDGVDIEALPVEKATGTVNVGEDSFDDDITVGKE